MDVAHRTHARHVELRDQARGFGDFAHDLEEAGAAFDDGFGAAAGGEGGAVGVGAAVAEDEVFAHCDGSFLLLMGL